MVGPPLLELLELLELLLLELVLAPLLELELLLELLLELELLELLELELVLEPLALVLSPPPPPHAASIKLVETAKTSARTEETGIGRVRNACMCCGSSERKPL